MKQPPRAHAELSTASRRASSRTKKDETEDGELDAPGIVGPMERVIEGIGGIVDRNGKRARGVENYSTGQL